MKPPRWVGLLCGLAVWAAVGLARPSPDAFLVKGEEPFRPVDPADPGRPDWLHRTGRAVARSADGLRDWAMYEIALNRQVPFQHLLVEMLLSAQPRELFIRLLDAQRRVVSADLFGNMADYLPGPGNVFVDIPLLSYPAAAIVQFLIPLDQEAALRAVSVVPASYEILMKTASNFVSGASAWIQAPIYDSKNLGLLADLVLLPEGRIGDLVSPTPSFDAYGVSAKPLEAFHFLPDPAGAYPHAGAAFSLQALPLLARFDVRLRHFDPLKPVDVWVNGQNLGSLSLDLPDLEDPAYWPSEQADAWWVGRWTRGWFYIPPEGLRRGDNTLVIGQTVGAPDAPALELRNPSLQFKYPWEEIATYSFVTGRGSTRYEPIVGGISPAPGESVGQEDEVFIIRADHDFRPVGPTSRKPNWLTAVDRMEPTPEQNDLRYRIQLNPANRPAQLGLDIIAHRSYGLPVTVSLLRGNRVLVDDLLGPIALRSGYVQNSTQLLIPLLEHPEADTILLTFKAHSPGLWPRLSRLQLKAAWPAAVVAAGHLDSDGSLADLLYDSRSDFFLAEGIRPLKGAPGRETVRHIPLQAEGEWYGVETRILQKKPVDHGDSPDRYFTEWAVRVDRVPQLARLDFLVEHLCVTERMEVKVNGKLVGWVSLHLPGVHDANYMIFQVRRIAPDGRSLTDEQKYAIDFGPYVRASVVFDGRHFRPGPNTLALGKTPRLKGTNDHYTFKDVRLQLKVAPPPGA